MKCLKVVSGFDKENLSREGWKLKANFHRSKILFLHRSCLLIS